MGFFLGGTRGPRFAGCSRTPRPTGRIGKNPVLKDHNPVNEIQTIVLYNLPMTSSNSLKFSILLNVSDLFKFLKFSHHREFEIQDFKQKTHQSKVILTVQVVRNKRYLISLSLSDSNIIKFFSLLLQITTADGKAGNVQQVQVMKLLRDYMTYV